MIIISYDIEYIIPGPWTANIAHDAALSAYAIPVQLISDLLDDKIPTEESYEAIVKLFNIMNSPKGDFIKQIGISHNTLTRALNYINDKQADPNAVEGFSPGLWREVRSLPKEEREEIKQCNWSCRIL